MKCRICKENISKYVKLECEINNICYSCLENSNKMSAINDKFFREWWKKYFPENYKKVFKG